jgi:hypothetical protein
MWKILMTEISFFAELYEKAALRDHCAIQLALGLQSAFPNSHVVDRYDTAQGLNGIGEEFRSSMADIDSRINDVPACRICGEAWGGFGGALSQPPAELVQHLTEIMNTFIKSFPKGEG